MIPRCCKIIFSQKIAKTKIYLGLYVFPNILVKLREMRDLLLFTKHYFIFFSWQFSRTAFAFTLITQAYGTWQKQSLLRIFVIQPRGESKLCYTTRCLTSKCHQFFRLTLVAGSSNGSTSGPVGLLPSSLQRLATRGEHSSLQGFGGWFADRESSVATTISCNIAVRRDCISSIWMTSTVSA